MRMKTPPFTYTINSLLKKEIKKKTLPQHVDFFMWINSVDAMTHFRKSDCADERFALVSSTGYFFELFIILYYYVILFDGAHL